MKIEQSGEKTVRYPITWERRKNVHRTNIRRKCRNLLVNTKCSEESDREHWDDLIDIQFVKQNSKIDNSAAFRVYKVHEYLRKYSTLDELSETQKNNEEEQFSERNYWNTSRGAEIIEKRKNLEHFSRRRRVPTEHRKTQKLSFQIRWRKWS